jgi:hypothetical protein
MRPPTFAQRSRRSAGYTLVELLVYVVISVAVLGLLYGAMITQGRTYGKQRELLDVRESVRSAAALLAWELRHASVAGSKVVAIGPDSIVLRSMIGLGTVCARHLTLPRYALWGTAGDIKATADDSAIVFRVAPNLWRGARIVQVGTPAALGVSTCSWPGARAPSIAVELGVSDPLDTADIVVGAGFRAFRETQYGEYLENGRYWLGRKIPPSTGSWEKLTGPLLDPGATGGLGFTYYDAAGAVTDIPDNVSRVELVLRAQSLKQSLQGPGVLAYETDSVRSRVVLRR